MHRRGLPALAVQEYGVGVSVMTILDKFLDPVTQCLTPDVARRIADIELDADTQTRMDDLAAKANAGSISEAERDEYADLVEGVDLLGIVKAEARATLRRSAW